MCAFSIGAFDSKSKTFNVIFCEKQVTEKSTKKKVINDFIAGLVLYHTPIIMPFIIKRVLYFSCSLISSNPSHFINVVNFKLTLN